MHAEKTGPAEDTIYVPVDKDDPSKVLKVGSQLSYETRERLTHFLIKNLDVFAWSHSDVVEIDPGVMCHRLNIFPNCTGIRQKRRPVSGEMAITLKEEVDILSEVGLIKDSFYHKWLANPVLVKKPNGKWMTDAIWIDQRWRDLPPVGEHDVQESFGEPWRYHIKLNPQKCVFGVESCKFLGFIVNDGRIEANPAKIKALLDMKSPTTAIKVAGKDFVWTPECEEVFRRIKEQLGNPPMLSKLLDGESLILYLAVSEYSISAMLVKEEDAQQLLVNYVRKRLHDAETR
ncbi:uncharacterized protein LOC141719162 [Apium graveolens]|uniref:uncharacterized protein LOC141719162 n=1 Tax=Apium graveolens TaxID=4045 RepID=UPI003D7A4BDD